ncbi:MAG: hypothetical protein IIX54_01660 [Clostridia bacterium]|nr:hypothetical protein [Clostridia bacterium]
MITALILIYTSLVFALGVIIGNIHKKGEEIKKSATKTAELNNEIFNFLNYDGTNQ